MNKQIPEFLSKKIKEEYPKDINDILKSYEKTKPVTFRINILKTKAEAVEKELINAKIKFTKVPWYNEAFVIENAKEDDIRKLNIYKDGKIYLQSLSSMIPAIIVNPKAGESILDMAAAPGGKTTQLSCLSNGKALITACEKNKIRAERLKYNIEKQGTKKTTVMQIDARNLDEFFLFDKILLDAPCSGSGTINLNEKIYINEELINRSIKIQKELLTKALSHLKQGGELVYSTCSILKEENENIINSILNENIKIEPIDLKQFPEIPLLPVNIKGAICIKPSELYEGFFIIKIKKK